MISIGPVLVDFVFCRLLSNLCNLLVDINLTRGPVIINVFN